MKRRVFLKCWIPPVVLSVTLPTHADTTQVQRLVYDFSLSDRQCQAEDNILIASFTICNNEHSVATIESVIIEAYGISGSELHFEVVSPAIPVTIQIGGCIEFAIQNSNPQSSTCTNVMVSMEGTRSNNGPDGYDGFTL